ncbi:MAG: 3'-5' exonuclease [Wenzhouxiangellaceae bacterium]|nr:3'-5' exonuclease [Wenzhouxiangellaceae bacterium]
MLRCNDAQDLNVIQYAVIDFETTGLSPAHGARPTEIAVVLVSGSEIIDRYQSLMNPGVSIPYDIQALTGITNAMVRRAPSIREVMTQAARFSGGHPIVAHNAAFDRKFWERETSVLRPRPVNTFVCSLLLARRLFPGTPNHKLATLVRALGLPSAGTFHRALADAECTAHLFIRLQQEIIRRYGIDEFDCSLLEQMQVTSRYQLEKCVQKWLIR